MQNINFYDRSLRIGIDWFGLRTAAAALLIAAVVVTGIGALLERQARELQAPADAAAAALQAEHAALQALARELGAARTDTALEKRLLALQGTVERHHAALAMLREGGLQRSESYASALQAFGRQSVEGLWLTGIVLDRGAMTLHGRSLQPELIPAYVQRLDAEPTLQGHSFRALDIRRPEAPSTAPSTSATPGTPGTPPAAPATADGAGTEPPRLAAYVEFSLVGSATASDLTGGAAVKFSMQALDGAFGARTQRERGVLIAAGVALVAALGYQFVIEPVLKQRRALAQRIEQQRTEQQTLAAQVQSLRARRTDPDAGRKAEIEALHNRLAGLDLEFVQLQRSLVAPREMGQMIKGLLAQHGGLQLVSLRSLPVTPLDDRTRAAAQAAPAPSAAASSPAGGEAWLYLHGLQITVRGSYADMHAYLDALEGLPQRLCWGALEIDARAWPASVLTVTIYTVSLERTWWSV